jgi:hypothetical protein
LVEIANTELNAASSGYPAVCHYVTSVLVVAWA